MQPLNSIAVRPPANTPDSPGSPSAPAPNEPVTAESLGWQLRAALPPLRLHSVSLCDEQANVLWLSEGALGPDEHNVVVEALDVLGKNASLNFHEAGLEDGRVAVFLPVRAPHGGLVGLAMILADTKSVGEGVVERMISQQVRTIMQRIAVLMRPAQTRVAKVDTPVQALELALDAFATPAPTAPPKSRAPMAKISVAPTPARNSPASAAAPVNGASRNGTSSNGSSSDGAPPNRAPSSGSSPNGASSNGASRPLSPQAVHDILEFELTPNVSAPVPGKVNGAAAPQTSASPTVAAAPLAPVAPVSPPGVSATGISKALSATGLSKTLSASSTGTSRMLASTTGTSPSLGATGTSRVLALPEGFSLTLEVQPFSKLRAGGRTRRFEVLARSSQPNRAPPGLDKIALQQLLTWMGANRTAWNSEPTSFTLNLSIATLEDERFPQFVASNLKAHGIAPDNIGFEVAEPLCLQRRAQVERFITLCDKVGCFVVIDDFSLDSSVVGLLRSKALRLVKMDTKLTSVAMKDKLAQAMVVAIAQAVKVLGIHCAAKRVETQAAVQWLTAIGCDFAQGSALAPVQTLESLGVQGAASEGAGTTGATTADRPA